MADFMHNLNLGNGNTKHRSRTIDNDINLSHRGKTKSVEFHRI